MNQTWINNNNIFKSNYHTAAVEHLNFNSYLINNRRDDFKPRAYVNPNIVIPYSQKLTSHNNMVLSKKIHVNPYFKGSCLNSLQRADKNMQLKSDHTVHVNPNFQHILNDKNLKLNDIKLTFPEKVSSGEANIKFKDLKINLSKEFKTEEMLNVNKSQANNLRHNFTKINSPKKQKLSFNSNANSVYFWSKDGANSQKNTWITSGSSIARPICASAKQSTYKLNYSNQQNIKTKHKIVHKNSVDQKNGIINKTNCSKFGLINHYKIVNVKKLKSDHLHETKILPTIKKRNILSPKASVTNILKKENNVKKILQSKKLLNFGIQSQMVQKNVQLLKPQTFNIIRNSSAIKTANTVKTKYFYLNKTFLHSKKSNLCYQLNTKYKIDKRKKVIENSETKVNIKDKYDIKKLFPKRIPLGNIKTMGCRWNQDIWKHNKFNLINMKSRESERQRNRIANSFLNRTVVNIGGILYKSASNKLMKTKNRKKTLDIKEQHFNTKFMHQSAKKHHVVYVRGEKFLLDENGKTLVRQPKTLNCCDANKNIVRVDIGGVTYIQKSSNVLIRTNTHQARYLVNTAKQRSIATLYNLHKRSNMPCMIYHKFGKCMKNSKGMCIYVHDPKNIALCKKFLKGDCNNTECLLSHNIIKEKMATCHFFLKGNCSKENCPFLHVKVNKKATVCHNFLQGFCALGQNCKKRHVHQCPEFDSKGKCIRKNKCPYPHKTNCKKKFSNIDVKVDELKFADKKTVNNEKKELMKCNEFHKSIVKRKTSLSKLQSDSNKRNSKIKTKKKREKPNENQLVSETVVECIPKRIKLDDLPLYIPLDLR